MVQLSLEQQTRSHFHENGKLKVQQQQQQQSFSDLMHIVLW